MISLNAVSNVSLLVLFQMIGLLVFIWSVLFATKQYITQRDNTKIAEAARLLRYFKEKIIPQGDVINHLLHNESITKICDKIDLDKMVIFTKKELLSFINEQELQQITAALSLKIEDYLTPKRLPPGITNGFDYNFSAVMRDCASDLEYVCIHLNSGIAHTKIAYQTLHKELFLIMPLLYIYISSQNTSDVNKSYTSIIHLYNDWRTIYREKKFTEEKTMAQEKS